MVPPRVRINFSVRARPKEPPEKDTGRHLGIRLGCDIPFVVYPRSWPMVQRAAVNPHSRGAQLRLWKERQSGGHEQGQRSNDGAGAEAL